MAQKNDTPALILALLCTLGVLGALGWILRPGLPGTSTSGTSNTLGTSNNPPVELPSSGERILIPNASASKQAGAEAYALGDYTVAAQQFEAALRENRNDPEALVYKHNALAELGPHLEIGAALPISTDENAALELMRGIGQAQQEINQAGGINGEKLVVAMANDGNDAETASSVAQTFGENPSILGVVGHYSSDISIATWPNYLEAELPAISPTSTSVDLSNASPYFFRTVPSDYIAARALAEEAFNRQQHQRAVVYFNSQSAYSQSLKGEFSTAFSLMGGQVVSEVDLSSSSFSPAQSLSDATQQGADVIMLLPNSGTLDKSLQVVAVNGQNLPILGGDDVYSPTTLEVGGADAQGMVLAIPWHIDASPDPNFPQSSRDLWYATVNWRTALTYDAVQAIAAALRSNPSREGIQQAFKSPSFQAQGASGVIRFLPSGDRNASVQLVTVEAGDGPGGYLFKPLR